MRLATRGSPLARWQAQSVADALGGASLVFVETAGDRRADVSLAEIGGEGVFVKEVQAAVLEGRADAAVHSAKDLPSTTPDGLVIGAVCTRADPRDALVGATLASLRKGATIATGSIRRRAQLAHLRPDLRFADLRGNIGTRLEKASGFDAIVMAAAALIRLGLADRITEALDVSVLVPQVAQGAIAVECRASDTATLAALKKIEDSASRWAVVAERAFLATLGGGCSLPVGAYATPGHLMAVIVSPDGTRAVRHDAGGEDPSALGRQVADHLLGLVDFSFSSSGT
ncbi:MAG: hydroxymethylbilane synthase [Acidimicrobiales bacterium]